ncbi:MAG: 16S rRNA (guanine(527)-N(7))-methyltransferase RsmG [Phycisphaerales bacterium]
MGVSGPNKETKAQGDTTAHGPVDRGPLFDRSASPLLPDAAALARAAALGIEFDPGDIDRLGRYLAFLRDANTRINLTAIVDAQEMWTRHVLDSLALVPVIASLDRAPGREDEPMRLIDVGSGGGLPGIPLAIVLPDVRCTLLEATAKKAKFLSDVAAALSLANVDVVVARAEDAGRDRELHRERYDVVTSRAVGPLPTLVELTVPFACVGGAVLAIKGEKADEEIAASKAALHALHAHALEPIRAATGTIVPIVKQRTTPKLYPRRAGEPKRAPIK